MSTTYPWPALVEAIRDLRPAIRMKWCGDDEPPPWEPWIIVSAGNYLETGHVGPVPFNEVEWVEIDPNSKCGRLVPAHQNAEVASALRRSSLRFTVSNGVFRISAK